MLLREGGGTFRIADLSRQETQTRELNFRKKASRFQHYLKLIDCCRGSGAQEDRGRIQKTQCRMVSMLNKVCTVTGLFLNTAARRHQSKKCATNYQKKITQAISPKGTMTFALHTHAPLRMKPFFSDAPHYHKIWETVAIFPHIHEFETLSFLTRPESGPSEHRLSQAVVNRVFLHAEVVGAAGHVGQRADEVVAALKWGIQQHRTHLLHFLQPQNRHSFQSRKIDIMNNKFVSSQFFCIVFAVYVKGGFSAAPRTSRTWASTAAHGEGKSEGTMGHRASCGSASTQLFPNISMSWVSTPGREKESAL